MGTFNITAFAKPASDRARVAPLTLRSKPLGVDFRVRSARTAMPLDIQKTGEKIMNAVTVIKVVRAVSSLFTKAKAFKNIGKNKKIYTSKGEIIMKALKAFIKTFILVAIAIVLFVPYVRDENGAYWLFKVPAGGQAYHRTTLGLVLIEKLKALKASKAEA